MKRTLAIIAFMASLSASAQVSMRDVWANIPDSIVPYVNKSQRADLVEFFDMKIPASVGNLLKGTCVLDTLTDNYASFTLNESTTMQVRLFPVNDTTQVVCLLKTFKAPEAESSIRFFNTKWERLPDDAFGLPSIQHTDSLLATFTQCPDTMSIDHYRELVGMMDPLMVSATLSLVADEIVYTLSPVVMTKKEREEINAILLKRKFKWNGEMFKEY